jgi:uncharacterized membrane protein YvbJ
VECPKCKADIAEDAKFCTKCGLPIVREIVCPKCEGLNSLDSKFCKQCGASLPTQELIDSRSDDERKYDDASNIAKGVLDEIHH